MFAEANEINSAQLNEINGNIVEMRDAQGEQEKRMNAKEYVDLDSLEVYQLARELSRKAWEIYRKFDWHMQKIIGDQFIQSADSVGSNIAEGYKRYHFLDKIKFYYNARASLCESCNHWVSLMKEREIIPDSQYNGIVKIEKKLSVKLSNFIDSTYNSKNKLSSSKKVKEAIS